MEQQPFQQGRESYSAPMLTIVETDVQSGFATSYDPTESIENVGSDLDYEEW